MEKYLIVFDLDGTMLPKVTVLPDAVRDTIRRLRADGHIPVIASARPPVMCRWVYEAMGLDTLMVCQNGSLIFHPKDANYQPRENMLSEERLAAIWDRAMKAAPAPDQIYVEANDSFYYYVARRNDETFNEASPIASSYWNNRRELSKSTFLTDLSHAPATKANRVVFFHSDPAANAAIEAALADLDGLFVQTLGNEDKTKKPSYRTMIFNDDVNKLVGVRAAQELYGIDDDHVLTFGDEWNDYDMLRAFKGGYALKGSKAERAGVGQPTDDTCEASGVARTLERLIYGE